MASRLDAGSTIAAEIWKFGLGFRVSGFGLGLGNTLSPSRILGTYYRGLNSYLYDFGGPFYN